MFIPCYSIFCYGCMFAFVVFDLVFSTMPRDWLGRTSPKGPILCRVWRKTSNNSTQLIEGPTQTTNWRPCFQALRWCLPNAPLSVVNRTSCGCWRWLPRQVRQRRRRLVPRSRIRRRPARAARPVRSSTACRTHPRGFRAASSAPAAATGRAHLPRASVGQVPSPGRSWRRSNSPPQLCCLTSSAGLRFLSHNSGLSGTTKRRTKVR